MFRLFEKALNPTEPPAQSQPPATLVAFYWHFARQAKGLFVALFVTGFIVGAARRRDPGVHGPHRHAGDVEQARRRCGPRHWPMLLGMAVVLLMLRPLAHDGAEPGQQPGDRGQRRQHDPLAEPLARGAPVLGVLPERFRRPHRQPGDADRAGGAREPGRADHRRLVHPGLRHRGADPARLRRRAGCAADRCCGSPATS